jgi:hypothetical protein
MALNEKIEKTEKKLNKIETTLEELQEHSVAMEVLKFSKDQSKASNDNLMTTNKRLFIIILCSLFANLAIGGFFIYYITHYTSEVTTSEAEAQDGGNACVGDNCNNGEINGKGEENYKKNS